MHVTSMVVLFLGSVVIAVLLPRTGPAARSCYTEALCFSMSMSVKGRKVFQLFR